MTFFYSLKLISGTNRAWSCMKGWVMMVKVMYTLTFHRLLWSILNVCLPRKTKTIQKKGIWSFLRHLTLICYLFKVFSKVKNRGSHLRKGSYLHLTLKIDLMVKIDGTVKCPPRSRSTFVRTIFLKIKYFRRYLGL